MPLNIYLFANLWPGVFNDSGDRGPSILALVANPTQTSCNENGSDFYKAFLW